MAEPNWRKPPWLRKKITLSHMASMEALLSRQGLHTVCEEAHCPNIGECFSRGVATFMILGDTCTRACTFCAVNRGVPPPPDAHEPSRVAEAVKALGLRHVVITSPTRDDLSDGGAAHFAATVRALQAADPAVAVELLIPDLHADREALELVAQSGAQIVGHNIETVPRLYGVRKGSEYRLSLEVLRQLGDLGAPKRKSALMLGLGERDEEVERAMGDLLDAGCTLLSIGQYLSPSSLHAPVVEYATLERFERLREKGLAMGFEYIHSSPYTRSSYMADAYLKTRSEDAAV